LGEENLGLNRGQKGMEMGNGVPLGYDEQELGVGESEVGVVGQVVCDEVLCSQYRSRIRRIALTCWNDLKLLVTVNERIASGVRGGWSVMLRGTSVFWEKGVISWVLVEGLPMSVEVDSKAVA
jgi:hypothetical protein